MPSPRHRLTAGLLLSGLIFAACGGSDLPDAIREPASQRVTALALSAGVALEDGQADCVATELPLEVAERLSGQAASAAIDLEDAVLISDSVIDCVGDEVIGRAALLAQAGGLRESSLECAAGELDRAFLVRLVAAEMTDTEAVSAEVELQVATAFGLCMGTDELMDR